MEQKSIFQSKTFWGVALTSIAAIAPIVGEGIDKTIKKEQVNYGKDTAQILIILCGAGTSIVGRIDAKSQISSPKWISKNKDIS